MTDKTEGQERVAALQGLRQVVESAWEPLYGFCAENETSNVELAKALEAVRRRICAYGGHGRCDCKYGKDATKNQRSGSEQTGCPELAEVIHRLLHRPETFAPVSESVPATPTIKGEQLARIHRYIRDLRDSVPDVTGDALQDAYNRGYAEADVATGGALGALLDIRFNEVLDSPEFRAALETPLRASAPSEASPHPDQALLLAKIEELKAHGPVQYATEEASPPAGSDSDTTPRASVRYLSSNCHHCKHTYNWHASNNACVWSGCGCDAFTDEPASPSSLPPGRRSR